MGATRCLWVMPLVVFLSSRSLAQGMDPPDRWGDWAFLVGQWELVEDNFASDGQHLQQNLGAAFFAFEVEPQVMHERQSLRRGEEQISAVQLMVFNSQADELEIVRTDSGHFGFWLLAGTMGPEEIVLREAHPNPGSKVTRRVTYRRESADRFQRRLEFSSDRGATWFVRSVWDYRRR